MSTQTTNLGLVKPDLTDNADISILNQNADKIDEAVPFKFGIESGKYGYYRGQTFTPFGGSVPVSSIPYTFSYNNIELSGAGFYMTANKNTPLYSVFPNGNVPCSVEAYYNSTYASGYIFGFGEESTRSCFSFTPSKFVGYSDDHAFSRSYPGKHHMVVVYDGNTSIRVYIDGELAETLVTAGKLSFTPSYVFCGCWMRNTGTEPFSGNIYFIRLYKTPLTAEQVYQLFLTKGE